MSFEVHVSRRAEQDIEAAYQWLRELDESVAERWLDGLEVALESLSEHPERCALATESRVFDQEIRQLLYGKRPRKYRVLFCKYRVLFCIEDETVYVLHVRHPRQAPVVPE